MAGGRPPKSAGQLKKLAKMAGFDADALVGEIAEEVANSLPKPQQIDLAALTQDVANQVNAQQATKLADILEAVKSKQGGETDIQGIIQGVAKFLQPQLMSAIKETSEEVFKNNSRSLIHQINANLEERLKKNTEPVAVEQPDESEDRPQEGNGHRAPAAGFDIMTLFRFALENSDKIAELASAFKPKVADSEMIEKTFDKAFAYHKMIEGMKKRMLDVQVTENEIKNLGKA